MAARWFELGTADGPMPVYESTPDGASRGGVLVIQEAFGITGHIESIADRLAEAGWTGLAPALFHRNGSPVFAYDDLASVMPVMQTLTAAGLRMDLDAALTHLESLGHEAGALGVVGFCMGGTVALAAATLRPLGAAVTFYGGGVTEGRFGFPPLVELAPSLKTPWLGLYGDLDKSIPPESVEDLRAAAATAPVATEIVRYANGQHGFNCDARPAVYDPEAAADAWGRTLAFFDEHLGA